MNIYKSDTIKKSIINNNNNNIRKILKGYTKVKYNKDHLCCSICLEEFKIGSFERKLSCTHSFHKKCIDRWLNIINSCPICRKNHCSVESN